MNYMRSTLAMTIVFISLSATAQLSKPTMFKAQENWCRSHNSGGDDILACARETFPLVEALMKKVADPDYPTENLLKCDRFLDTTSEFFNAPDGLKCLEKVEQEATKASDPDKKASKETPPK